MFRAVQAACVRRVRARRAGGGVATRGSVCPPPLGLEVAAGVQGEEQETLLTFLPTPTTSLNVLCGPALGASAPQRGPQ